MTFSADSLGFRFIKDAEVVSVSNADGGYWPHVHSTADIIVRSNTRHEHTVVGIIGVRLSSHLRYRRIMPVDLVSI